MMISIRSRYETDDYFDPEIIRNENYLMIPIKIWYGTTELQTKELPDNDSNQNDMEQQNYLMMISIQSRYETNDDSDPK